MITYRGLYRAFCLLTNKFKLTTYKMISLSASSEILPCTKILVEEQQTLEIPAPRFSGFYAAQASQKNQAISIKTPRLEIYEFKNAMLIGGVDFILNKDLAIHHDLFVASAHHMPAEYRGVAAIDRTKNTVKFYLTKKLQVLDNAVNLIGQCSGNYAHWLTETLPKLVLLDAQDRYADFPLVVDDGLHENIYRSLEQINQKRRAIIKIGRWNRLTVANCVTVSHTGYERYEPHGLRSVEPPAFVNVFSRLALKLLREVALQGLHETTTKKHGIYLARNSSSGNIRHVENRTAIDAVIEANNINFIHPDSMNFKEQVFSCKDATVIVAPVGAALANMSFAPPGCTIIALAPYYDQASYFYYSNLSGALGHTMYYVLGQQISDKQHPIHRNYTIDPETLSAIIKWVI